MPPDPDRFSRHGALRVSDDRTHLAHADGTPFFYLADTAWSGPLLSTDPDWQTYLDDRAGKGFTAIQFITHAPWTAALTDREGQTAFTNDPANPLNEAFFARLDQKIAAINQRGLLAVPVLAWAANFGQSRKLNLGHTHTAQQLIPILRAQIDRLAQHHTLLILAGDGVYNLWRARKWKRVGRALFADRAHPLVALHPAGQSWPYAYFEDEPWLTILGYQSSHSEHPKHLEWLQSGPPAQSHAKPTINLEPVYEGIAPGARAPFDDAAVRRAVYWSLLNAPTAGVAYGAHGVWSWNEEPGEPLNHTGMGVAHPWHVAMNFPGSTQMSHLAKLMGEIKWWTLRPDPTLLPPQKPGPNFIAASRSPSGELALIYTPHGTTIRLSAPPDLQTMWFNPRTGERHPAAAPFNTPDAQDWLLLLLP